MIEKELFTSHFKSLIHCIAFWDVCMCCVFEAHHIHASLLPTSIQKPFITIHSVLSARCERFEFNFQFFFSTFFYFLILQNKCAVNESQKNKIKNLGVL